MYSGGYAHVHHCSCYFDYVSVFALSYTVLLRRMSTRELAFDSFLSEIRREFVRKVFFASV